MKARWNQASSLAMLCLVVACIATPDILSDVTDALGFMEKVFKTDISDALDERHGVLAQFTMGHETYSTR
jgi:hypothetical protein